MQAHFLKEFCLAKIVFYPKKFPLLLPSHNCIIIHNVQFSRYMFWVSRNSMKHLVSKVLQSISRLSYILYLLSYIFKKWWAKMDSNHRPHDYQSCALASWAIGPFLVEISGIEPLTSCLQGRRSPSWAKPPNLHSLLLPVPSKLNNAKITSSRTDLRTLQAKSRLAWSLLRKEVIQPHLPIRLPCYDFTPITGPTFGRAPLAVRLRTSGVLVAVEIPPFLVTDRGDLDQEEHHRG